MVLNGNAKFIISIGIAIAFPTAGAIGGFAVNNYRIGKVEDCQKEEIAANKYEHNAIMKEAAAMQKEVLSAVTELKVEMSAIKTEMRMIRRNNNPDR